MVASSRQTLRFVACFTAAGLLQFAILLAPPVRPQVDGFSGRLALVSASLIRLFGGVCVQHAAMLAVPAKNFAMEVRDGCNGVNVVILLWSAMVAYPVSWNWKLAGMAAGLAAIQILKVLRLISLFYLGQYSPSIFEFAHLYLWETLIILDAIVVFAAWTRYAEKR